MDKKARNSLVAQRADLLATEFLTDLEATLSLRVSSPHPALFDLIAVFKRKNAGLHFVAVKIKGTEELNGDAFHFREDRNKLEDLRHANLPVMYLVVDVKQNHIYYGWADEISINSASRGPAAKTVDCALHVSDASEKKSDLLERIFRE